MLDDLPQLVDGVSIIYGRHSTQIDYITTDGKLYKYFGPLSEDITNAELDFDDISFEVFGILGSKQAGSLDALTATTEDIVNALKKANLMAGT